MPKRKDKGAAEPVADQYQLMIKAITDIVN